MHILNFSKEQIVELSLYTICTFDNFLCLTCIGNATSFVEYYVTDRAYTCKKDSCMTYNEATSDTEDSVLESTEISIQTEATFTNLRTIAVQTDITIHPDCCQLDVAIHAVQHRRGD